MTSHMAQWFSTYRTYLHEYVVSIRDLGSVALRSVSRVDTIGFANFTPAT
jgi:hypothetical protein